MNIKKVRVRCGKVRFAAEGVQMKGPPKWSIGMVLIVGAGAAALAFFFPPAAPAVAMLAKAGAVALV